MQCTECECELAQGDNVLLVERGIIGVRGPVSLGQSYVFCSDKCLSEFFGTDDLPRTKRRVP